MNIILGSSSKWRQQIMKDAGYKFTVMIPDIDERKIRFDDPKKLTLAIAHAKTDALLPNIKEPSLLITCDQVVECNDEIFEKPRSKEEARYFLESHSKYPVKTFTAIVVTDTLTNKQVDGVDIANIDFYPIPSNVIEQLIEKEETFECAGGFQIEKNDCLNPYIKTIDGSVDSVKGLPISLLEKLIDAVK